MEREFKDASIEFGSQLKRYLHHFDLIEADIAYLIGSNSNNVGDIITGDKDLLLKTVIKIANFFGLTYFEMGDPSFPIPKFEDLPSKTQEVILKRKELGTSNRDYNNDLAGNLDKILNSDFLHTPHTAEEIWAQLPEEVRSKVEPRRITDLLGKSPRNSIVEKISPSAGEGKKNRYVLKK